GFTSSTLPSGSVITPPAATTTSGRLASQVCSSRNSTSPLSATRGLGPRRCRRLGQIGDHVVHADLALLAARHVAHGHDARLVLGVAVDQAPPGALVRRPLELLAQLPGRAEIDRSPQPGLPGRARERERPGGELLA